MARVKAGILVRVSDPGQHTDNQLSDLLAWADRRGGSPGIGGGRDLQVPRIRLEGRPSETTGSSLPRWSGGQIPGLAGVGNRTAFPRGAVGHWRLSTGGIQVWSYQEPWTEAGGELLDLLRAIAGWVAKMESNRRSEGTKAGLRRAINQGKRLGRPPGSRDKKKRSRGGYFARWAE